MIEELLYYNIFWEKGVRVSFGKKAGGMGIVYGREDVLVFPKEMERGYLLRRPSLRQIWRRVIVPQDFCHN